MIVTAPSGLLHHLYGEDKVTHMRPVCSKQNTRIDVNDKHFSSSGLCSKLVTFSMTFAPIISLHDTCMGYFQAFVIAFAYREKESINITTRLVIVVTVVSVQSAGLMTVPRVSTVSQEQFCSV